MGWVQRCGGLHGMATQVVEALVRGSEGREGYSGAEDYKPRPPRV